jgi:hypothetical protein
MYFRLEWAIRDLSLRDEKLNFSFGGPHEITVSLRAPTEAEQKEGHNRVNAFCIATSKQYINAHIHEMFDSLSHNKLPKGSKSPKCMNKLTKKET